jgi:zinc protease
VFDDQIATNVTSYLDAREISGQFVVAATAKPGQDLPSVEKALDEELERFLKTGPTEAELERVKTQYAAGFIRGIERIGGFGGKSDILARSQTFTGAPDTYKQALELVEAANPADLTTVANNWLDDGVYVLNVTPYPPLKANGSAIDRKQLPEILKSVEPKFPRLQRATLSNGLKVILAERHEIPVVNFWLEVEGGYSADRGAKAGTARLTASLLTSGTAKRNALEISDETQLLGAQLSAGSSLDFTTVYLSALKAKLDPSLDLFADVILNPTFPLTDFSRQKSLQLASIESEKANPMQMALRVLPPLLYGAGHVYSLPLTGSGTTQSVSGIEREEVENFHATWFKPNNATLIVVGDTTLAEILPKLEGHLGSWKKVDVPSIQIARVDGPQKPALYLIDKPEAQQSVIMAGAIAPPANSPLEIAFEAVNNTFGGTFSARLNMNLREEKHWSYGARAILYGARGQRPYLAIASVQTDKTKDAVSETLRELNDIIGSRPVSEPELERVKSQTILELGGARETMNSIGSAISEMIEFGLPDNYWETYPGRVSRLGLDEVNQAAKSLIKPRQFVWVIVGDRAKIEDDLELLELGEIVHIDADGNPV